MRTFSIATKEDSLTLVEKAKRIAAEKNVTFEGDTTSGTFSGSGVEGEYEVEDGWN